MRWLAVATVVLAALVATGAARAPAQEESDCMTDPLGPVPAYSIVTLGDLDLMNTDAEGRGGPGRVAIHGRGGASLLDPLGTAASHGCIRVDSRQAAWLARVLPPGAPVEIR